MKLTAFILLVGWLHVSARGYSQTTVTLSEKNVSLQKVFQEIHKQTGYQFFYEDALLDEVGRVDVNVKNVPVEQALSQCFKDLPLMFSIVDKAIVVKKRSAVRSDGKAVVALPESEVRGFVKNQVREPLVGATVVIKRTGKGTITDAKGNFILKGVQGDDVFIASFIGYKSREFSTGSPEHLGSGYTVILQETDNALDKVVIQGYGNTSQRFTTGDITTVTAAEIEKQPVMNPLMALQGRVAGLDIQQLSGYASGPIKAEIRGRSTVDGSPTDPLYVIDGVPLTVLQIGKAGTDGLLQNPGLVGPGGGQSPLFSIDPSSIESITVLKDADATSIYGSRGANGVILITTKKGKAGKSQLSLHADEGANMVTRFWKLLNTPQYLTMRREAFKNDGITPDVGSAPDLFVWDTTRYTDWQRALYGRVGKVINAQLSLSGGDERITFRIGANYSHATNITSVSGADQQGNVSFSLSHRSINDRLTITLSTSYTYTQSDLVQLPGQVNMAPDAPSIFDSAGKLNWKQWDALYGPGSNPFGTLMVTYSSKTNFLNSSLGFNFQPFRGFAISTTLGYNTSENNQISLIPISANDPANQPTGTSQYGYNSVKNWLIEPHMSYDAQIGKGKFNILVGGSMQQNTTYGLYYGGSGYTTDVLLRTVADAPQKYNDDNFGIYKYASVFGKIGYILKSRYMVNLNARRDGSSNYGPGNQYGAFASVGVGWIFTEEPWIKDHLSFLSFGKFRGSYGAAGSDGGKPYAYLTRWSGDNLGTYDGLPPLEPTQHANPNYQWQVNRKLEGAVELSFFKGWISANIVYYRDRTGNQLLYYPTPYLSGFNSVLANLPALVQNSGWEFTFGGRGVQTKYFSWAPNINFSFNQNKFLSFPGLGSSPYRNNGMIGRPLNGLYLLHYTGVDPQTGQYTYQDKNHDGVITNNYGPNSDVYFKKVAPSFATGFGFNFDLKGFNLSLFFSVKKQVGINAFAQTNLAGNLANQPVEVLNRWQKPGDISAVGKFSTISAQDPYGYLGSSDIGFTDASYIRLQNLSLSYNLPAAFVKKAGMQSFSLFVHANNILLITDYKGIDPEVQAFGGLPPSRTIVGGVSINF